VNFSSSCSQNNLLKHAIIISFKSLSQVIYNSWYTFPIAYINLQFTRRTLAPAQGIRVYGEWRYNSTHSLPWRHTVFAAQFYALDALPTVSAEERTLTMMRRNKILCRCRELNEVSVGLQRIAYSQHHSILENTVVNVRTSGFKVKNVLFYNHTVPRLVSSDFYISSFC